MPSLFNSKEPNLGYFSYNIILLIFKKVCFFSYSFFGPSGRRLCYLAKFLNQSSIYLSFLLIFYPKIKVTVSVWWMDDAWWVIIIYTFLSKPSVLLTHVVCNQRGAMYYAEVCQQESNKSKLFWTRCYKKLYGCNSCCRPLMQSS